MIKFPYSMPEKREKEETMDCKNCGSPLEENQTVCPSCGEDNGSIDEIVEIVETKKKKAKWTKKKIVGLVLSIIAGILVLSLVAGIVVLATRKNDVYYKEKYLTSDFWVNLTHDQVVATMGDYELTNGQLQVYYWTQVYDLVEYYVEQYGEYALYYLGLDLEKPLNEQIYNEENGMTWEQYFLEDALYAWHRYQALADEAKKVGYQLPAEYQKAFSEMRASMEETAEEEGYDSVDAMLQNELGSTVTFDDYYRYMEVYWTANLYFSDVTAKLVFTDAELEAFYEENEELLAQYGVTKDSGNLVDFRNILVKPVATKDSDGNTVYTDEAWETCRQKAQTILDTWLEGDKAESTFASLAGIKSEDKTSSGNGGLYQYVAKNAWATVDVRHILIIPEGGEKDESGTSITYSEKEWEDCRVAAQAILDQYLAGEQTAEAFGELANEHSDDQGGKVTNGGLYAGVKTGEMVEEFDAWIFDSSRKSGDTGLVKTRFGYHIMYFVGRNGPVDDWAFAEGRKAGDHAVVKTDDGYQILYYVGDDVAWEVWCREGLMDETSEEKMQSYANTRPIDVRYWAVMLSDRPTEES